MDRSRGSRASSVCWTRSPQSALFGEFSNGCGVEQTGICDATVIRCKLLENRSVQRTVVLSTFAIGSQESNNSRFPQKAYKATIQPGLGE